MTTAAVRPLATLVRLATALLAFALPAARAADAPARAAARRSLYDFRVATMDGSTRPLADYRGKVLLVVNTASRCGFTPQYRSLEALYEKFRARGFEVLAFPANNFLGQEPGSNAQIASFCSQTFHTRFPLFAKLDVKGERIAPLYAWLTRDSGFPGDIPWNFTKFLVGRDGAVVARFDPKVDPLDPQVTSRLEQELNAK